MGKATNKRARAKRNSAIDNVLRPTEARQAHNDFETAGMAYRVRPVIDTLKDGGRLSQAEYDNLKHYRDQACRAEDDCAQEGTLAPARMMGGGGGSYGGKIPAIMMATPAIIETARIERDLGSLQPIAHAIAVNDWTLSRWCIEQHGGRERYDGRGKFVAVVPVAEKRVLAMALMELRFAAGRIAR